MFTSGNLPSDNSSKKSLRTKSLENTLWKRRLRETYLSWSFVPFHGLCKHVALLQSFRRGSGQLVCSSMSVLRVDVTIAAIPCALTYSNSRPSPSRKRHYQCREPADHQLYRGLEQAYLATGQIFLSQTLARLIPCLQSRYQLDSMEAVPPARSAELNRTNSTSSEPSTPVIHQLLCITSVD